MSKRVKNSLKKLELPEEVNQAILRLIADPYLYYEEESQKAIRYLEDLNKFGKPLQRKESAKVLPHILPKKTSSAFINLRPDILLFIIERYLTIINKRWTRKSYKGKPHEKKEHIKASFEEVFPRLKYPKNSNFDTRSKLNTALSFFCYRYELRFDDIKKIYSKWKKPKESAKYIDFEYNKLSYRTSGIIGVSYIRTLDPIEKLKFVEAKRKAIQKPYIQIIDPDERRKFLEMKRNTKKLVLEIPIPKDLIKT